MTEPEDRDGPPEAESARQVEFHLGGRHLALGVVGLFLLGAVLFLLGRWSERMARSHPAALPVEEVTGDSPSAPPAAGAPRELTFYETLGRKGTPGLQEAPRAAAAKEPPAVLPDGPPPRVEKPTPTPSPSAEGESFRVQVASTRDAGAARQLAERLRRKGYAVRVDQSAGSDGHTRYKVRVGNYPEREPAEKLVERIRAEEKMDAWIVKVQG